MRVLFLFFILSIARSPSYQKCISALANFDGFNGSEIVVTFPEGYSEVELKETVENLGHLVLGVTYTSDIRNREKEEDDNYEREKNELHEEINIEKTKCEKAKELVDLENSKLYFWQNKMEYEACEYLWKLNAQTRRYIYPRGLRGPTGPDHYSNKIKLRVF
jgi:hypothetical protein